MTAEQVAGDPTQGVPADDIRANVEDLYRDGITARRGAFSVAWVDALAEDVEAAFQEARNRPGGAVGRGPQRWYVEVHPEQLRGFVDLVTHPWITAVNRAVLGEDYQVVEIGFDVPLPGAMNQPWHRDFAMPDKTRDEHRLTSLAFNLTLVDTTPDMGPFEIAPGTQWDDDPSFAHGMFPDRSWYPRYEGLAQRKLPQRGDVSARSALTIHRGTANQSQKARPVLILGAVAGDQASVIEHSMAVTRDYWAALPDEVRAHIRCPVVDELVPITQRHSIEGLVMGDA
jgi:ectoine hydroxylase-related dioxygenase (phytanoyl-CoA dioxygenase family)